MWLHLSLQPPRLQREERETGARARDLCCSSVHSAPARTCHLPAWPRLRGAASCACGGEIRPYGHHLWPRGRKQTLEAPLTCTGGSKLHPGSQKWFSNDRGLGTPGVHQHAGSPPTRRREVRAGSWVQQTAVQGCWGPLRAALTHTVKCGLGYLHPLTLPCPRATPHVGHQTMHRAPSEPLTSPCR